MHSYSTKLSLKLKAKINNFAFGISSAYKKHEQKFISEIIFGLLSNQSSRLSQIARALKEKKLLKITHNRLRLNLEKINLSSAIFKYSQNIKSLIDKDAVISVDPGDITKRYATKMENLSYVHDGSAAFNEPKTRLGYNLIQIVAVNPTKQVIPLLFELFSVNEKNFKSINKVVTKSIEKISKLIGKNNGVYVLDRGNDAINIFKELFNLRVRFIVRMASKRDVILGNNRKMNIKKVATKANFDYQKKHLLKLSTKDETRHQVVVGIKKIKLPGYKNKLNLVVLKQVKDKKILMWFLTNEKISSTEESFQIIFKYLRRWGVEDAFRYIKQSYDLEDIRLRNYNSLKNMVRLIFLTFGFLCITQNQTRSFQLIDEIIKQVHTFKSKEDKTDFLYYVLSSGIHLILSTCKYGLNRVLSVAKLPYKQLKMSLMLH